MPVSNNAPNGALGYFTGSGGDDTGALQDALNNREQVVIVGQVKVGSVTVPDGGVLSSLSNHGSIHQQVGQNAPSGMLSMKGTIFGTDENNPTIRLSSGAKLENLAILREGHDFRVDKACPDTWQGLAVQFQGDDAVALNNMIVGYHKAIYSDGVQRPRAYDNRFDCLNGIHFKDVLDVGRMVRNHGWNFGTVIHSHHGGCDMHFNEGSHVLQRNGIAFFLEGHNDWTELRDNFSYGYRAGTIIVDGQEVTIIGGGADNTNLKNDNSNYQVGMSDSTGLGIYGWTKHARISGFTVAANQNAYYFATNSTDAQIKMSQCRAFDCRHNGIVAHRAQVDHTQTVITGIPNRYATATGGAIYAL